MEESQRKLIVVGFWMRLAADFLDAALLFAVGMAIAWPARNFFVALGSKGVLIGLPIAFLYAGISHSAIGGGQTPGKRLLDIQVVGLGGEFLSLGRSLLRYGVLALLFYNGVYMKFLGPLIPVEASTAVSAVDGLAVAALLIATFFLVPFHPLKRGLHDIAAGSLVVRKGSFQPSLTSGEDIPAKTRRAYVACAVLYLLLAAGGWAAYRRLAKSQFLLMMPELLAVQKGVEEKTHLEVSAVRIMWFQRLGDAGGPRKQLLVGVAVPPSFSDRGNDRASVVREICESLMQFPDLVRGIDALSIVTQRGFNLGIASWSWNNVVEIPANRIGEALSNEAVIDILEGKNARITKDSNNPYLLSVDSSTLTRYQIDPKWDDLRRKLYSEKNYPEVEAVLTSEFQKPGDGAHDDLGRLYGFLSSPFGTADFEQMKPVLDEWVVKSSSNYAAWLVRGYFYTGYAWDARGYGGGSTLTPEMQRLFSERLSIAKGDLETACQLNPHEAHCPAALIRVSMGLGLPRAEMEKYFAEAVAESPGIAAPYLLKIRFLAPRWYGSVEDMSAVGEEAKSKSIEHPRLARIWVVPFLERSRYSSGVGEVPLTSVELWGHIQGIYADLLAREPDDLALHAEYAGIAYYSTQYRIAAEQYDLVGDRWIYGSSENLAHYNFERADAYYRLGWEYEHQNDDAAAARFYQKAADLGLARGMSALGLYRETGRAGPLDYAAALDYFQRAARFDDPSAYANMGWLYQMGHGVPVDMAEAIRCYKKGSDLGDVGASYRLGWMYYFGKSTPQDYAAAISLLEKAAKGGNAEAQDLLGWMYEQGNGTPVNDGAAAKWFQAAAAQGNAAAAGHLKWLQSQGRAKTL